MKTPIILSLSMLLTSCMHVGMMGINADHQSKEHQTTSETTLQKEVTAGNVKATAMFPPMVLGEELMFSLTLIDAQSREPISGALVSFHATYLHKVEDVAGLKAHMMHTPVDSAHTRSSTDHSISFDRELKEQSQRGLYSIAFTPSQLGEHTLMFHVTAIGDETLEPQLIIETTRNVSPGTASHGGMMHGMSSTSEYLILGGALMGAMMVVMWVTRGTIF